jgi:hypothetical protein
MSENLEKIVKHLEDLESENALNDEVTNALIAIVKGVTYSKQSKNFVLGLGFRIKNDLDADFSQIITNMQNMF